MNSPSVRTRSVKVMIVEDEPGYREALTVGLESEGFEVVVHGSGVDALLSFAADRPDVVLLDVMLPGISGLDVCREIRTTSTVPIIMLTAKGSETDTVVGLEVGADDYVTKPYRLKELVARIRAVSRRGTRERVDTTANRIVAGGIELDVDAHEVRVGDEAVEMPLREFELLEMLMRNAGKVLTRDLLIERLWGIDYVGDTKTLDVHIKRLRSKLEQERSDPRLIVTVRGLGYKFDSRSAPTMGE